MKFINWVVYKNHGIFALYFSCISLLLYCLGCAMTSYNMSPSLVSTCKLFVLNLDSCKDRLRYIIGLLDEEGLQFERVSAIEGNSLKFYDIVTRRNLVVDEVCKNKILKNKMVRVEHWRFPESSFTFDYNLGKYYLAKFRYKYRYKISLGELGCYYSHRVIWQKIIDEDIKYAIVLEDDANIEPGFAERMDEILHHMPPDTDFISLERREPVFRLIDIGNRVITKPLTPGGKKIVFTGTCGYVVTNQGARKLLESTYKGCFPIDVMIPMSYFDKKAIHYVVKEEIVKHNRYFESIITNMGRRAWNELHEKIAMMRAKKQSRLVKDKAMARLIARRRRMISQKVMKEMPEAKATGL